ncbi:MAG: FUSC family protein, partial [Actinomycetota bacterium]
RARGQLELYAVAATQVDLAVRNTRVLARAARGLIRLGGPAPAPVVDAVRGLAAAVDALSRRLDEPQRAEETRDLALEAVASAASVLDAPDALALSSVVGQVRLTASDLLRATGFSLAQAQQALDRAVGLAAPDE